MSLGRRAIITGAQREELWRRYEAGETILGIGRTLGERPTTIHRVLQATGGIGPGRRSRSARALSLAEREEVSRGISAGHSFHAIAKNLRRAVSTVSQEVSRHGDSVTALPMRTLPHGIQRVAQELPARQEPQAATDRSG